MTAETESTPPLADEALARRCVEICEDRKAQDIRLYDVTGASMVTDFYLICSGSSDPHLRAIQNRLSQELTEAGVRAAHIDGGSGSRWVVMDYGTVLVHIFHPELRRYYEIEKLLGEERLIHQGDTQGDPVPEAPPPPSSRFDLSTYEPPSET